MERVRDKPLTRTIAGRPSTARATAPAALAAAFTAALTVLAVLLTPGLAVAEGPGYGGGADKLVVRWKEKKKAQTVEVYGVGFRGGSGVRVRVGSGAEESASTDPNGSLRVVLERGRLTPGASILVAGQSPSGTALRLVGSVPQEPSDSGLRDTVPWLVVGGAVLAAMFGVGHRHRRQAQGSKR